jgi:peptidoglycan/xylan/chitin deacetylase (PgdA/CDA1 family)
MRPLVLCYHGVSGARPHPLFVSVDALRRQLALLMRRGYRWANAEQLDTARGRLLHVTFDDAFENVLDVVPVLEQVGASATVFACTGLADDGAPPRPMLEEVGEEARSVFATMRWHVLAELSERGVAIGSHTVTHPHLTELSSSELDAELASSRERLEDELGTPCRVLAYPFGESDSRVRAAARKAGYDVAFGLPGDMSWSDPYNRPRTGVWRKDGLVRFAVKTSALARTPALSPLRALV